ncbi:uncharacterized protein LOC129598671 [Paramacrobiotus metropolitanus]|uniref:uncharacterized protein LOC129598671 n=1 Tax=Paramacrobiotus metropolitanus TaxID=2943436 RepID=UPI002445DAB8|nr:uncharacterized protein LOC129598671 [Paramacrobiotus metropolitanus]
MPQEFMVGLHAGRIPHFDDYKDVNAYIQPFKRPSTGENPSLISDHNTNNTDDGVQSPTQFVMDIDSDSSSTHNPLTHPKSELPSTFVPGFHDEAAVRRLRYKKLGSTGMSVSALAIGGGGLERFYGSLDEDRAIEEIQSAIRLGLNYVHTAPWYGAGKSEAIVGKALAGVPRKAYFIATKVGRYNANVEEMFDFSAERVTKSIEESLSRLGLTYVDVIQVHDLEFAPNVDVILNQTLPALERLRQAGKARFIGITGYPTLELLEVVRKSTIRIDTVLSYCRYGFYNNDLMDIIPELRSKGVGVINAAPLGLGLLSKTGPEDWHPASDSLKLACRAAVLYTQEQEMDLEKVVLKFCYWSDDIDTTVASMVCVERPDLVNWNINAVVDPLTDKERMLVEDIKAQFFRVLDKTHWEGEPVARYWDALREEELMHKHHQNHPLTDAVMSSNAKDLFAAPGEETTLFYRKSTI